MKTDLNLIKKARADKQRRQFFIYILGCPLIAFSAWKFYSQSYGVASGCLLAGAALISIELYATQIAIKLFAGWMKFAKILGTVNTWILLSLIYVLVFCPLGLIKRFFHREDSDEEKFRKNQSSWIPIDASSYGKERYHRAF